MKQGLELKLGQQLKLNSQLQQSLKLLQLSQLELEQEISLQLESNPLLATESDPQDLNQDWTAPSSEEKLTAQPLSKLPQLDTNHSSIEDIAVDHAGLRERLEFQLQMSHLSRLDLQLGYHIIENLNQQGFLCIAAEEIAQQVSQEQNIDIQTEEVLAVIHHIQQLEPLGCASKDLQEFLTFQLSQESAKQRLSDEQIKSAKLLLTQHFHYLSKNNYPALEKQLKLNKTQLQSIINAIKQLRQRPNNYQEQQTIEYISPDVKVIQDAGTFKARLPQKHQQKLFINQDYQQLLAASKLASDKEYLQQKLQQAQTFLHSLEARESTLQRVADFLVNYQQDYFSQGFEALKPLRLNDVAEELELHESTISRATSNKYCQTPHGTIRLKNLFSNAINSNPSNSNPNNQGGEWSQAAIKNKIQQLIQSEPSRKPLSDNSIVQLLAQQGVSIARRTVAKYRGALQIPSASRRKQLIAFQQINQTQ